MGGFLIKIQIIQNGSWNKENTNRPISVKTWDGTLKPCIGKDPRLTWVHSQALVDLTVNCDVTLNAQSLEREKKMGLSSIHFKV